MYVIVNVLKFMSTVVVLAKNVLSTCKLFVAKTLVVVTEFDTYTFPVTWRFAVGVADDPIPTFGT